MLPEDKFFQTNDEKKIWERYCGFLDLTLEEFMQIQQRLLMEQIELVAGTPLAKTFMNGNKPQNVEEFRKMVPLTTYEEYADRLCQQDESVLAEKPLYWCHSSGRGGRFKWMPYTARGFDVFAKRALATTILGATNSKGKVNIKPGIRTLLLMPPRPYTSGSGLYNLSQRFSLRIIPSLEETEDMEFSERVTEGFHLALQTGVDMIFSLASVLVKMGETMSEQAQETRFSWGMLKPPVLSRLIQAKIKSRFAGRPMLPKDLWKSKAIFTSGIDVGIYRDQITRYWGQVPYEVYGGTEVLIMAIQGWNRKWMTFVPDTAFWEFIPEEEHYKALSDPLYQPKTVLFNEVEKGKTYEVVLTHFYGMPLLRYKIKDMVTYVELEDKESGIKLPQMQFKTRVGETINLGNLTDLDESAIWQAIENTGIKYEDWTARKEYRENQVCLALYMELNEDQNTSELELAIDRELKKIDIDYQDIERMLGIQPIKVNTLSSGTFGQYYRNKEKGGVDLANRKPPHMNASDEIIQELLKLS